VVASRGALRKYGIHGVCHSIPFIAGQWSLRVAGARRARRHRHVSIPFIAGQWSLHADPRRDGLRDECFNPLHCGAVVASSWPSANLTPRRCVSIPFIAGQWSLRTTDEDLLVGVDMFQSPSLRGSGRFTRCTSKCTGG